MTRLRGRADAASRNSGAQQRSRPPSASSSSPRNTTSSQRLMPMPGRSQRRSTGASLDGLARPGAGGIGPAADRRCRSAVAVMPVAHSRSSSRCQTLTGPLAGLAPARGDLLGDRDRAVLAAGAAERDRQPALALRLVAGERVLEVVLDVVQERRVIGWPSTNSRTGSSSPLSGRRRSM